jgi:hypothetical protein
MVRLEIQLEPGTAVRDPSVRYELGRVVAIVDHGDGQATVLVDLDEDNLRSRLRERRGAF